MKPTDPLAEEAKRKAMQRFNRFGLLVLASYIALWVYFIITVTIYLVK